MTPAQTLKLQTQFSGGPESVCGAQTRRLPFAVSPPTAREHRDLLLLGHLAQVRFIARRIHGRLPPQVLLDDLIHAGVLGLMDAIKKYDPAKKVQLKHYAEFRIRGAILDSLRQADWSPRTLRSRARRLEQAVSVCRARLGRDPTEPEIASSLRITLPQLQRLLGDLRRLDVGSLQLELDKLAADGGARRQPCREDEDPYHQTLRCEMRGLLTGALDQLPVREQEVLALYDFDELTMKEVAAAMGIGESRVSQIHTSAMIHLRARLFERLHHNPSPMCNATSGPRPGRKRLFRATTELNKSAQKSAG